MTTAELRMHRVIQVSIGNHQQAIEIKRTGELQSKECEEKFNMNLNNFSVKSLLVVKNHFAVNLNSIERSCKFSANYTRCDIQFLLCLRRS